MKETDKCPAYGRIRRKIHSVVNPDDSGEEDYRDEAIQNLTLSGKEEVNKVTECSYPKQVYATMHVRKKPVKFQLDLGATCNIIPKAHLGNISDYDITDSGRVLIMYNKATLKPLGHTQVRMVNPRNGKWYIAPFVVIEDDKATPLLGSRAIQQMGLVKVQYEK
jgi:hypothetical protein